MPIQQMNCPRCGKPATEYDENKWRCLICQTKFIYEEPQKPAVPDSYVKHDISILNDGIHYTCAVCTLVFSQLSKPSQKCSKCGEPTCPECFGIEAKDEEIRRLRQGLKICDKCVSQNIARWKAQRKAKQDFFSKCCLVLIGVLLLFTILQSMHRKDRGDNSGPPPDVPGRNTLRN